MAAGAPGAAATTAASCFGGAITMQLPAGYRDLSELRPVPDNQEVYVGVDPSGRATGSVVIIEIVESPAVPNEEVARYLWEDLADASDTFGWHRLPLPPRAAAALCGGGGGGGGGAMALAASAPLLDSPRVSYADLGAGFHEDRDSPPNLHVMALAVVRLPFVESDVVVYATLPSPGGRAAAVPGSAAETRAAEIARGMLASLCVHDWALFGEPTK